MHFIGINSIDELVRIAAEDDFMTPQDLEFDDKISPKTRKILNKAITPFTTSSETNSKHFDGVPIGEIADVLEEYGYTLLQEDNTPWSGFLVGEEGRATIALGVKRRLEQRYEEVKNAMLIIGWYKIAPGKYEVTAYIS